MKAFLTALIAAPIFAVSWGFQDGDPAFILYREPKLTALSVLGWIFLTTLFAVRLRRASLAGWLNVLERPAILAFGAFLSYMTLGVFWTRVRENHFYELNQWILLLLLLTALLRWTTLDPEVPERVRDTLLCCFGLVTLIGLTQLFYPIAWLAPINPEIGARNPSVFGYKNPAALAILGQIFLLAGRAMEARRFSVRLLLFFVLLAEIVYLASLRSRTAYVALFAGILLFAFLQGGDFLQGQGKRKVLWTIPAIFLVVAMLIAVPVARDRAATLVPYMLDPALYLESDRGIYLRNTLDMARAHPLGVGLGDWQTEYPVHRRVGTDVAFTEQHQVRRAHSDHVQFLGEGGFLGVALWFVFLGSVLVTGLRAGAPFYTAQFFALTAAMASDYLLDLPFHKLLFILIVFLVLTAKKTEKVEEPNAGRGSPTPALLIALLIGLVAVAQIAYHVEAARKAHEAAWLESLFLGGAPTAQVLERGASFATRTGHTKTFYKDWLIFAEAARRSGRLDLARAAAHRSLELHPYAPNTLRFMASIEDDEGRAEQWMEAYRIVQEEGRRPVLPPLSARP